MATIRREPSLSWKVHHSQEESDFFCLYYIYDAFKPENIYSIITIFQTLAKPRSSPKSRGFLEGSLSGGLRRVARNLENLCMY